MAPPTNTPGQGTGPNDYWFLNPSDYHAPSEKWDGNWDDMHQLVHNMSPTNLDAADASYKQAFKFLNDSIEAIETAGHNISQVWRGEAANNMQESLKKLHQTAYNLAEAASMLQNNLFHNTAEDIRWAHQNAPDKQTPSGPVSFLAGAADVASDVSAPVVHLFTGWSNTSDAVNKEYDEANKKAAKQFLNIDGGQLGHSVFGNYIAVPDKVHTDLPNPDWKKHAPTTTQHPVGPSGKPSMPSGGPGAGKVPHPSVPTHPNVPTHPTPSLPHSTPPHTSTPHVPTGGPHGTDLAGMPTGGPGGGLGPLGPGGGGLPPSGLGGGLPPGGGPGGLGPGGGLGGGLPGGALGAAGEAAAAEEAAAARAAMAGKGANGAGMPMGMGGGGQGQKEERERSTWLTEDEDVWGGDGDVAPPVIG
jgi:uncharacterized protein YukE